MSKSSPVQEGDHVSRLDQATSVARREMQRIHDPRQLAVSVASGTYFPVARQVGTMLCLPFHLVGDDKRILAPDW